MALSLRPSHRNPMELQPEVCELCGTRVGHERLVEADVEGLRGFKICDTHGFERRARVTPSYNDYQRTNPPLPVPDVARQEPIGGESWFLGSQHYYLGFNGTTSYASGSLASPSGPMTLSVSLRRSVSIATLRNIGTWYDGANIAGLRSLQIGTPANTLRFNAGNDSGTLFTITAAAVLPADDEFHDVDGVLDTSDSVLRLFIDGEEAADPVAITGTFLTTEETFYLGALPGTSYFPGDIDRCRLWNRALPQVYASIYRGIDLRGDESGLVAEYTLNEGTGTTTSPRPVDQASLTISGATWTEVT